MVIEFLLFGVVEVFILLMFYKYVGKIDGVKWWHGIVLCVLFFFIGLINFPFVKQIGMIFGMLLYLFIINKKISIKEIVVSFLYLLCVEAIFCVIYETIFLLDVTSVSNFVKFKMMIPIRLAEIGLILLYKRSKINGLDMVFGIRRS